jgi:hypothetical protein
MHCRSKASAGRWKISFELAYVIAPFSGKFAEHMSLNWVSLADISRESSPFRTQGQGKPRNVDHPTDRHSSVREVVTGKDGAVNS